MHILYIFSSLITAAIRQNGADCIYISVCVCEYVHACVCVLVYVCVCVFVSLCSPVYNEILSNVRLMKRYRVNKRLLVI